MKYYFIALVVLALIAAGCRTFRSDAEGNPSKRGDHTARVVCGVTISVKPIETISETVRKWLMRGMGLGAVIAVVGLVLLMLNVFLKIPATVGQYWDETTLVGLTVIGSCGLALVLWSLRYAILAAGIAIVAGVRIYKMRSKKALEPESTA